MVNTQAPCIQELDSYTELRRHPLAKLCTRRAAGAASKSLTPTQTYDATLLQNCARQEATLLSPANPSHNEQRHNARRR